MFMGVRTARSTQSEWHVDQIQFQDCK